MKRGWTFNDKSAHPVCILPSKLELAMILSRQKVGGKEACGFVLSFSPRSRRRAWPRPSVRPAEARRRPVSRFLIYQVVVTLWSLLSLIVHFETWRFIKFGLKFQEGCHECFLWGGGKKNWGTFGGDAIWRQCEIKEDDTLFFLFSIIACIHLEKASGEHR